MSAKDVDDVVALTAEYVALVIARDEAFDAVILDLAMPRLGD